MLKSLGDVYMKHSVNFSWEDPKNRSNQPIKFTFFQLIDLVIINDE